MDVVYLAYEKGVTGHPGGKDVELLRLMSMEGQEHQIAGKAVGAARGRSTSLLWSPDSLKLAFVSYEQLPEEALNLK